MVCLFYATGVIMVILNIMELYQISGHVGEAWRKGGIDITKDNGSDDFPMFEMAEYHDWVPGADGGYRVPVTGYPDATGLPNLMMRQPDRRGRHGNSGGIGYRSRRRGYR